MIADLKLRTKWLLIGVLFISLGSGTWCPLRAQCTALVCDRALPGTIDPSTEVDCYTFSVVDGEIVAIGVVEVAGAPANFDARWRLLNGKGELVGTNAYRWGRADYGPLPAAGNPYRVEIFEYDKTGTGGYGIHFQRLTQPCDQTALVCDRRLDALIDPLQDTDLYSFTAAEGEVVAIGVYKAAGAPANFDARWRLLNGKGELVGSSTRSGRYDCGPLLAAGNPYRVEVFEYNQDGTGGYGIHFQRLTRPCDQMPLVCGTKLDGSIDPLQDTDLYSFNAVDNETMTIEVLDAPGAPAGFDSRWRLLNQAGQMIGSEFRSGKSVCGPLPAAGNPYCVEVYEYNHDATGGYSIQRTECGCTYSISPTQKAFPCDGGTGSVNVTTGTGCAWTARSNVSWITIGSGSSGTGAGVVTYTVAKNSGTSVRNGTLTVAGLTFTATQDGCCAYSISPTQKAFPCDGGTGSVNVTTGTGCAWTARSNDGWITITSGGSGSGSGVVAYTVARNSGQTTRAGTLTVAGKTFTVTQEGCACTYSIAPTEKSFPCEGGAGNVNVTAGTGCAWTARSNVAWITITSGGSGSGSGIVAYTVARNTGQAGRTGTLTVADQTFTVRQDGCACAYSIAPTNQAFPCEGGTGSFEVTTGSGCAWTVEDNGGCITVTAGANGTGTGRVFYSVGKNQDPTPRSCTLTVAGHPFTVTQDGCPCAYSISPESRSFPCEGGTGSLEVITGSGCAWTARSDDAWIIITSGASGSGPGVVEYTVQAYAGQAERAGTVLVAGQTFVVRQRGNCACDFALDLEADPGARVLRILLTNSRPVAGGQLGVSYDPKTVVIAGIDPSGVLQSARLGQGPEFFEATERADAGHCTGVAGGLVVAWIVANDLSESTPAGSGQEIIQIRLQCPPDGKGGTEARFCFEGCLASEAGGPPIDIAVSLPDGTSIAPCIGPCEQVVLRCGDFIRGDTNQDCRVNIGDAIGILCCLFLPPGECNRCDCDDARDTNDDGQNNIADPIYLLNHLFAGGPSLPAPTGACGPDPTPDGLDCDSFTCLCP